MIHIIMGSKSDEHIAEKCTRVLVGLGVRYRVDVASAHRTPKKLRQLVERSDAQVLICIAGLAAALPGSVASMTTKPVIGVPVNVKLEGLDALLSCMQMPPKVPVATVGIDNGVNAALLAVEILAVSDAKLSAALEQYRGSG